MRLAPLTEATFAEAPNYAFIIPRIAYTAAASHFVKANKTGSQIFVLRAVRTTSDDWELTQMIHLSVASFTSSWGKDLSCYPTNSKEAV